MQVDDANNIDVVMPMYNLIEYSNNYSKASRILWQSCRYPSNWAADNTITDFTEANWLNDFFKINEKITR